jgi:hypothetical protein
MTGEHTIFRRRQIEHAWYLDSACGQGDSINTFLRQTYLERSWLRRQTVQERCSNESCVGWVFSTPVFRQSDTPSGRLNNNWKSEGIEGGVLLNLRRPRNLHPIGTHVWRFHYKISSFGLMHSLPLPIRHDIYAFNLDEPICLSDVVIGSRKTRCRL